MTEVQNFDHVHPENRSFILGGETFHWEPMWWRDFGEMIEEAVRTAMEEQKEADEAKERGGEEPQSSSIVHTFEQVIDGIVPYLVVDEVQRFKDLVNDRQKRISHLQLNTLSDWLREVSNNRPTEQPSPSDAGHGSGVPTLQAV